MKKARICAVITSNDPEAIRQVAPWVDLFEVRIDYLGEGWQSLARQLNQPWIACNRIASEGGRWQQHEDQRIAELLQAVELGASLIDIELATANLDKAIPLIKPRAQCLLSFHDLKGTPPFNEMKEIVKRQLDAGADICKVVTTANRAEDNLSVLRLIAEFPKARIVSFAMGASGLASRILCPLVGGDFTYAAITSGKESAPGQLTVTELRKIYDLVKNGE